MPQKNYRPEIGETVIVSLSDNLPFVITVTGYEYHSYLKEEIMKFDKSCAGGSNWSTWKNQTFFTEISVDTKYFYVVVKSEDFEDRLSYEQEMAFFFEADQAFEYMDGLEGCAEDYYVEVRKLK